MTESVVSYITKMNSTKIAVEVDILKRVMDIVQSTDRGPASEIIDLAFGITGYGKSDVPGGESQAAGQCIATLVRYLVLRAKEHTNESLEETLSALVTESVRLYAEVNTNYGGRSSLPLTQKRT